MALTKLNNQSLVAVTAAGIPIRSGSVLQVVQFTNDTQEISTSSTFANTSFVGTITPSSSTSKVLALCQVALMSYASSGNNNRGKGRLYRNVAQATNVVSGDIVAGGYNYGGSGILINHTAALNWLDSPSTTSATTYTFQIAHISGTETRLNYGADVDSHMILMEIAG
jgi:type IV secretory pathway TraG/TraD family ATPase VirD4